MDQARAALLLIDMQKESKYGIDLLDEAVAAAIPLIECCRRFSIPVIYTRQVNRSDGVGLPTNEVVDGTGVPTYYRSDSDAVGIIDDVSPKPNEIVLDKLRWSGFFATPLDSILRSLGVRELLLGGFVTDGCVLTTAFDAFALDYRVTLVKDICAATNIGAHQSAILTMSNWIYGIEIIDAAEQVARCNGERYSSWRSTAPDQMQFTGDSLDSVFASLTSSGDPL